MLFYYNPDRKKEADTGVIQSRENITEKILQMLEIYFLHT